MQCIHLLVMCFRFSHFHHKTRGKLYTQVVQYVCVYSVNNDLTGVEEVGVALPEPRLLLL